MQKKAKYEEVRGTHNLNPGLTQSLGSNNFSSLLQGKGRITENAAQTTAKRQNKNLVSSC